MATKAAAKEIVRKDNKETMSDKIKLFERRPERSSRNV